LQSRVFMNRRGMGDGMVKLFWRGIVLKVNNG
jgi:hypothetical protein